MHSFIHSFIHLKQINASPTAFRSNGGQRAAFAHTQPKRVALVPNPRNDKEDLPVIEISDPFARHVAQPAPEKPKLSSSSVLRGFRCMSAAEARSSDASPSPPSSSAPWRPTMTRAATSPEAGSRDGSVEIRGPAAAGRTIGRAHEMDSIREAAGDESVHIRTHLRRSR